MNKVISPVVADFMVKTSTKLFNAAQSGDPEYALALLQAFKANVDIYIDALKEG